MQRRRVIFKGRVQGVGFRMTAQAAAGGYAITGWVRNEPDGAVALEAQGTPEEIDRFLDDVRRRMGRLVLAVEVIAVDAVPGEAAFHIRP